MQIEDLVECLGIKNPDTRTKAEVERDAALGKFILLTELFAYDLMIMEMLKKGGFDPNQPRVPAGNHDGGQWTDEDGESDYPDAIEEVYPESIFALLPVGSAVRTVVSAGKVIKWTLGNHKSPQKWQNQMKARGWTEKKISETIAKGDRYPAKNKMTGGDATRFQDPKNGKFVVRDDVTGEILQVSDSNFVPND